MTMIKGNDGITLDNVDLTHATTLECEKCKCKGFKQTLMLKKLSALVSPSTEIDPLLKEYVFVPAAMLAKRLVAAISTPE